VPVSQSLVFYRTLTEKHPEAACYLDIFDGGHEMDIETAAYWILSQYKKEQKETVTG